MELFLYLQTLPFLKYINKKALIEIENLFYFRSILCDAYCVFKLDKNAIMLYDNNVYDNDNSSITTITSLNSSNSSDIRLDIVIALDIKHKPGYKHNNNNNDTNNKDNDPALYFIFNKKYHFLVDHTLITELAAPRNAGTITYITINITITIITVITVITVITNTTIS